MFLIGLGSAAPTHRYRQAECWDALCASAQMKLLSPRARAMLMKVLLGDNGIETRHFVLEALSDVFAISPDILTQRFVQHAPALATTAAERALQHAGITAAEIDGVIISTCTGYLCPGLTSYVSERLGLRTDVRALDLVGHGCGAALPSLQTAEALLASRQCTKVLMVCVEICSAAFYLDDDPGVLVSACLFGDGAAAVVLANHPGAKIRRVEWLAAANRLSPADRDSLRFEQRGGMLRNILSKETPVIAGRLAVEVLAETLQRANVPRPAVTGWMVHPGGRNILIALRHQLGLSDDDLRWSAEILREYGNMSSASVLFVLQAALEAGAPGGYWWMSSFGAGFSSYGAMLRVD